MLGDQCQALLRRLSTSVRHFYNVAGRVKALLQCGWEGEGWRSACPAMLECKDGCSDTCPATQVVQQGERPFMGQVFGKEGGGQGGDTLFCSRGVMAMK